MAVDILPIYAVVIGVLLILKLIFWILWYYFRQRRIKRMMEAGLIRPADSQSAMAVAGSGRARLNRSYCSYGESLPAITTAYPSYMTASTVPATPVPVAAGPPAYEEVTKGSETEPPPSYQQAVSMETK